MRCERNGTARRSRCGGRLLAALAVAACVGLPTSPVAAQARPLSIDDALDLAESASEEVRIAEAGIRRARGEQRRAFADRLPQLSLNATYTRTFASEFEGVFGGAGNDSTSNGGPPADPEDPDDGDDGGFGDIDFGDLPFGRENVYRLTLSLSQNVWSGGRIGAREDIADAGRASAEVALASARAEVTLAVAQAYYGAVLADRLVEIAEATLAQAERTLEQTVVAERVGQQPEFDLLRARVAVDNERVTLVQRRTERGQAHMRLKQLLDLPMTEPLDLTTELGEGEPRPLARFAAVPAAPPQDPAQIDRAPVRQAAAVVRMREASLDIAESQRLPQISINAQYGRIAYPNDLFPSAFNDFRTNATAGLSVSIPLFTGGRIGGDELAAEADVIEARSRLRQVEELAYLDTWTAWEELERARAQWEATTGTEAQAQRAYEIAEIRYREGISTQLELADARILLQQASANRARAARDLQIARIRVALLPDLPLSVPGAEAVGGGAVPQPQAPQPPPPAQQGVPAGQDPTMTGQPGTPGGSS